MEGGGREIEHEEPNSGPLFTILWEAGKQPSVECPREECKATSVKMRHPGRTVLGDEGCAEGRWEDI